MGQSGNEAMTPGAGSRWCGLAGMAGGLLLLIFYAALAARQPIDWQAGRGQLTGDESSKPCLAFPANEARFLIVHPPFPARTGTHSDFGIGQVPAPERQIRPVARSRLRTAGKAG